MEHDDKKTTKHNAQEAARVEGTNALKHGLFAQARVLPWEDAEEFSRLAEGLIQELRPEGPSENVIILQIAELEWRKRRLNAGELLRVLAAVPPELAEELKENGAEGLAESFRASRVFVGTSRDIAQFRKSDEGRRLSEEFRSEAANPQTAKISRLNDLSRSAIQKVFDPDVIESRIRAEAAIDARITKLLSRLVVLKEYKRQYLLPVISAAEAPSALECLSEPEPLK